MLFWLAVAWGVIGALSLAFAVLSFIALLGMIGSGGGRAQDAGEAMVATLAGLAIGLVCLTVGALLRVTVDFLDAKG